MSGMVLIAALGRTLIATPLRPLAPDFWFVTSMVLLVGFVVAYPMNWSLVAKDLKHGMMTVRSNSAETGELVGAGHAVGAVAPSGSHSGNVTHAPSPSSAAEIERMAVLSIAVLALATWLSLVLNAI